MRVLVTGAQGKLGRAVASTLVEAGHEVRGLGRFARHLGEVWEHQPGDLRDLAAVQRAVQDVDAVVYAVGDPETDAQLCQPAPEGPTGGSACRWAASSGC